MAKKDSIENLATAVYDNGRRGNPRPGCDCVQCFGYCQVDPEIAARDSFDKRHPPADADVLEGL